MRQKEINFKFNKKRIKPFKMLESKDKNNFEDYYSKILLNFFESDKKKEERKNNNENSIKSKKFNKLKISSNSSNKNLKIDLNGNNHMYNTKNIDISKNNDSTIKGRKTANINKKFTTKKLIQCISEKNITKDNKNSEKNLKGKTNTKIELFNQSKKNDFSNHKKIKLNLYKNNNQTQKPHNNINKVILNNINNNSNNKKENKNKSTNRRKQIKIKNTESEKNINLKINIKEKMTNKKSNHQYNNNKNKNIKSKKSPENVKVNEYSLINNKKGGKNLNRPKKMINTDINSNSKMFNKKNVIKSTGNISTKNILENNYKINSLKKHIIDKKGIKNNNATKQDIISKRMKVESIKIDLNLVKSPKNYSFISQEKTTAENYKLNEKNNLTLRVTDTTKFKNNNRFSELNTAGQNEMSELNQSFRTSFSLYKYKSRSLSKKREERKRSKLHNLDLQYDSEENNKKLNNILISLSNLNSKNEKKYEQKSEPKRLIDRIRKYKKLQKL